MDAATIALTVLTGAIGLIFLGFLIWGWRSGQFYNIEEAKYQVFRERKPPEDGDITDSGRGEVNDHAEP
jgi:nitrogen fixation-related uncharacterized protein